MKQVVNERNHLLWCASMGLIREPIASPAPGKFASLLVIFFYCFKMQIPSFLNYLKASAFVWINFMVLFDLPSFLSLKPLTLWIAPWNGPGDLAGYQQGGLRENGKEWERREGPECRQPQQGSGGRGLSMLGLVASPASVHFWPRAAQDW